MRIARGSLNETRHWFRRRAYNAERLLDDDKVAILKPLLDELAPRLNAYLRSIGFDRAELKKRKTQHQRQETKDKEPRTMD